MKKKLASVLLFCTITTLSSFAQVAGWHYQAAIDSIRDAGFYNILLTPEITAHLKTDYSDLRIVNDSGKWVPHLLRLPNTELTADQIIWELPIIKKENTTAFTELIIKSLPAAISNLVLKLRNTDAERFCTLTGSDDSKKWFIINDSILIMPGKPVDDVQVSFNIRFPLTNYKFYKLILHNNGKAPFDIIGVGSAGPATKSDTALFKKPIENPAVSIIQKDSGKLSYIKVTQQANYHFDEIRFKISGAKYFSRAVDLYIPQLAAHSFKNPGQLSTSFTISNNSTLQLSLPIINADTFYLIIHNEDNLPVKIEAIKTYKSFRIATAYFEKGNNYKIVMGNETATTPNYDLQQLNISNKQLLPSATIGAIAAIPQPAIIITSANNNKWLIWLTIGIAAIVLGFFTYKLITEMNKSTT